MASPRLSRPSQLAAAGSGGGGAGANLKAAAGSKQKVLPVDE